MRSTYFWGLNPTCPPKSLVSSHCWEPVMGCRGWASFLPEEEFRALRNILLRFSMTMCSSRFYRIQYNLFQVAADTRQYKKKPLITFLVLKTSGWSQNLLEHWEHKTAAMWPTILVLHHFPGPQRSFFLIIFLNAGYPTTWRSEPALSWSQVYL